MKKPPKPFGRPVTLNVSLLNTDPRLQMRKDGEEEEHAEAIAIAIKNGAKVPRIKVMRVQPEERDANNRLPDPVFYVVDGRHTLKGWIKLGKKNVPCSVQAGTWAEAVIAAASANQEHLGLRRTNADKRKAVEAILELPDAHQWTNSRIAQQIGVSGEFVRQCRPTVDKHHWEDPQPDLAPKPKTRTGADGRQYPVDRKPSVKKPVEKTETLEAPKFDWKGYETSIGEVVRGIDRLGRVDKEFAGSPEQKGMRRLMEEFTDLAAKTRKRYKAGY